MLEAGFWDNQELAQQTTREVSELKRIIKRWQNVHELYEDVQVLLELVEESEDQDLQGELTGSLERLEREVDRLELESLLSGEYDASNAILTIHPGAGGTESQDWASMLWRMYTRWAEDQGYGVEVLDHQPGDEAGIKDVTLLIKGLHAYGYLKSEKGVHRLVRISPFDSSGRRHTSFSSVEVLPEIEDDVSVEINPDDLRIDTYRSSGKGGQHVNRTDSAVRMTHLPTGIVVQCQSERSQIQNRETCMRMLRAKLAELHERERQEQMSDVKGELKKIEWGSQIRSYVFQPYTMVKDHRTGHEMGDIGGVMDGDLEGFVTSYLQKL